MRKGTYRAVHTSLWDDPDYERLSPEARHVLLVLRLGTQSNLPCCYRLRLSVLSENTGYPLDTLSLPIAELEKDGWIEFDGVVVWVRNGLKYDPQVSLANPKHFENVIKVISGLPKSQIVLNFCKYYSIDTHDIGYQEGIDTVSPPNPSPTPIPNPKPNPNPNPNPKIPPAPKTKRTATKKNELPKQSVWAWWIDTHRARGKADPVKNPADLGAVKTIQKMELADDDIKKILGYYLDDRDNFISNQGHPLRLLPTRINKYTAKGIDFMNGLSDKARANLAAFGYTGDDDEQNP